ncbi:MAG: hypothetical protein ACI308_08835 [Muribaculaceae bacterium]
MALNNKQLTIIGGALIAALIVVIGILVYSMHNTKTQLTKVEAEKEEIKLQRDQYQLAGEYEQLNTQFQSMENQTRFLQNDSILNKYTEARDKVEKLLAELKSQKISSQKRINELQNEIKTLKSLMRHYVAIIDSLGKENAGLRAENQEIRSQNEQLSNQVSAVSEKNANLTQRMILAEKLNVTGVTLTPIKSNGKTEKNIKKAKQLKVTFTIPQNNSTPVGEKTLYVRITSPEGTLLGSHGSFSFEGSNIPYTEKKDIEYTGQEIAGITIYWNINSALSPGEYTVEIFADNYRLASRRFTIEK